MGPVGCVAGAPQPASTIAKAAAASDAGSYWAWRLVQVGFG